MSGDFSIDIRIDATFFGYTSEIRNQTNLCDFRSFSYVGATDDDRYSPTCPLRTGPYELFTSFTVPQFTKAEDLSFTPDLHIEFFDADSDDDDGETLIGCVETGAKAASAIRQKQGETLLIICTLIFVSTFAICLFGHRRRRKAEELAEASKQAAIIRRFHYMRTSRNGSVIPNLATTTSATGKSLDAYREVT
jgi:hypothetical protein